MQKYKPAERGGFFYKFKLIKKMDTTNELTIIAGPCSVDENNMHEVLEIAKIKAKGTRAIAGTRVVGLKSRTALSVDGKNMGIDFPVFMRNLHKSMDGVSPKEFEEPPSVALARTIREETGLMIATEVMNPMVQLPSFESEIFRDNVLIWSPAVSQLGWPAMNMALFAKRNGWHVGIKNGKWHSMEKTWKGLSSYVDAHVEKEKVVMIQRGVEVPEKGQFRSLPVHDSAVRMKDNGMRIFFDPSHSFGPKLRDKIVDGTVEAMKMKTASGQFVYDGVLVEVGTSVTDTEQHITVSELDELCGRLAEFRLLVPPIAN